VRIYSRGEVGKQKLGRQGQIKKRTHPTAGAIKGHRKKIGDCAEGGEGGSRNQKTILKITAGVICFGGGLKKKREKRKSRKPRAEQLWKVFRGEKKRKGEELIERNMIPSNQNGEKKDWLGAQSECT